MNSKRPDHRRTAQRRDNLTEAMHGQRPLKTAASVIAPATDLDTANSTIAMLAARVERAERRLAERERELAYANEELVLRRGEAASMEQGLLDHGRTITSLRLTLATLLEQTEASEGRHAGEIAAYKMMLHDADAALAAARPTVDGLRRELAELRNPPKIEH